MRIACITYREWALNIYDRLADNTHHTYLIIRGKNQYSEKAIKDFNPQLIFFYGWSWIIKEELIENYKCIMLHPSPLPKYRGGSPLQNQIIANERSSMVTLFFMNNELDAGDIIAQEEFSLEGSLNDIFTRITDIGYKLTYNHVINVDTIESYPQDHTKATYCKRRTPEQSEITLDELSNKPAEYLYNKIRMLSDPYPNAFIKTSDNKKLFILKSKIEENK